MVDWYVVQVQSLFGTDHKVFNLLSQNFRCHMVQEVKRRRVMRHGRPVILDGKPIEEETLRPVFPGYIFVSFDAGTPSWGTILRTQGVLRLFCRIGKGGAYVPSRLPVGFVETWQARGRAGDGALDDRKPSFPAIPVGADVKILAGIYESFEGVVKQCRGDRVVALLAMFGREVPVEMDRVDVEPVQARAGQAAGP